MNVRNGKIITILLVEDSFLDIKMVQEAFSDLNIENSLQVATDGEDAMDFLHRAGKHKNAPRPHLVLLDLNLPRKDGREVLSEMKSDNNLKRIPVVILTSSRADEDIATSYDLHVNCFVRKPIDAHLFIETVKNISSFWLTVADLPSGL
jgi:chemotaxis family two-component system response regulator Rcp1